jgi:hypothetical protein
MWYLELSYVRQGQDCVLNIPSIAICTWQRRIYSLVVNRYICDIVTITLSGWRAVKHQCGRIPGFMPFPSIRQRVILPFTIPGHDCCSWSPRVSFFSAHSDGEVSTPFIDCVSLGNLVDLPRAASQRVCSLSALR